MCPDVPRAGGPDALVITPTYNEIETLETTLRALLEGSPDVHVLVVDDGSPDGTGTLADRLAAADAGRRIHVLHRTEKAGLGAAYVAGFRWALERGYRVVVEMDADGSHPASALPAMRAALAADATVGLVIGSRRVAGGGTVDWPWYRRMLSGGGNAYARLALGIPVRDITAGYRAYRADVLAGLDLSGVDSRGYCFQIDMTVRTVDAGWAVREVPIEFRERIAGVSKMSGDIVAEAMWRTTLWGIRRRLGRGHLGRLPGEERQPSAPAVVPPRQGASRSAR